MGARGRSPSTASGWPSGSTCDRNGDHLLSARGWTRTGGDLWEVLARLERDGCARYVVTDVSKDGTLRGPNVELLRDGHRDTAAPVVASGGIAQIADLAALAQAAADGSDIEGAIVGKALYAGPVHAARGAGRGARRGHHEPDGGLRMGVAVRVIPCLDVDAGRVVKGVNFREPARRGRPGRDGRASTTPRARTSSRSSTSRRRRAERDDDARRRAPHRRAGVHPAHRRGRHPQRRRRRPAAARGRGQGQHQHRRDRRPELLREASRRFGAQCIVLSVDARTVPRGSSRRRRAGRSPRTAGAAAPGSTPSSGRRAARSWAWGRSCSTRWTPTARARASTCEMIAAVRAAVDVPVIASGGRGPRRALRARGAARAPTRCSRPACSTSDSFRIAEVKDACAAAGGRCGDEGRVSLDPAIAARLKRDADGLVCAVAQQRGTGEVLMVAWMDDEALHRTLTTGRATYWSRSRQEYWVKGDTSGHVQQVHEVRLDCDGDALLLIVDQTGRRVPHRRPHVLRRRRPALLACPNRSPRRGAAARTWCPPYRTPRVVARRGVGACVGPARRGTPVGALVRRAAPGERGDPRRLASVAAAAAAGRWRTPAARVTAALALDGRAWDLAADALTVHRAPEGHLDRRGRPPTCVGVVAGDPAAQALVRVFPDEAALLDAVAAAAVATLAPLWTRCAPPPGSGW